jgi:hypothetical protein
MNLASAQIMNTGSLGQEKNSFYTNESVYIRTFGNISTSSVTVDIYVTYNNDTWPNGTSLTDVAGGKRTVSTNSSGQIPITAIWSSPAEGSYDVVVDVNKDGLYNQSIDYVDNESTTGFTVLIAPIPTLKASVGHNSPNNHNWDMGVNGTNYNPMLQVNLTAGSFDNIRIDSIGLLASGTGDDRKVSVVYLIVDRNDNGKYDSGDTLLAYDTYKLDDGVITFTIPSGYRIDINATAHMLIIYKFSNTVSAGDTFAFQIISIIGYGINSGELATITGMPVNSATTTISGVTTTTTSSTTTTTGTTSTTTTSTTSTTTTTTLPPNPPMAIDTNVIIILVVIIGVVVALLLIYKIRRRKEVSSYDKLKEKWSGYKWKK